MHNPDGSVHDLFSAALDDQVLRVPEIREIVDEKAIELLENQIADEPFTPTDFVRVKSSQYAVNLTKQICTGIIDATKQLVTNRVQWLGSQGQECPPPTLNNYRKFTGPMIHRQLGRLNAVMAYYAIPPKRLWYVRLAGATDKDYRKALVNRASAHHWLVKKGYLSAEGAALKPLGTLAAVKISGFVKVNSYTGDLHDHAPSRVNPLSGKKRPPLDLDDELTDDDDEGPTPKRRSYVQPICSQ